MEKIYQEALELHEKFQGKIETNIKQNLTKDDLSLIYTPGVAQPCKEIVKNKANVYKYTMKSNTIAVITDGSAVLGLGNIGAEASLPVMEGKCALFKRFGDVNAFPICLNTQDTNEIIGIIKHISPGLGGINLEDISAPRCFEIEEKLKKELNIPIFHDDQHGTAIVVLAFLINALKLIKKNKEDLNVVINGAGAAGFAITNLLYKYGFKKIIVCDSKGIICKNRNDLNEYKQKLLLFTNKENKSGLLEEAIKGADIFIGVSKGNLLTKNMIKSMNQKPVILALANPTPEIFPTEAFDAGAYIVGTGRSDFSNQINNVLVFPALFHAILKLQINEITDDIKIRTAHAIASTIKEEELDINNILPNVFNANLKENVLKELMKFKRENDNES